MHFDAYPRSFAGMGSIPRRGIYDNMKRAIDKVEKGNAHRPHALTQIRARPRRSRFNQPMSTVQPVPSADAKVGMLELDLRHLPPPQPMQHILHALESLGEGQVLLARTPCRPQPLLALLEADGYDVDVVVAPDGDAWVRISAAIDCRGDGRAGA